MLGLPFVVTCSYLGGKISIVGNLCKPLKFDFENEEPGRREAALKA